MIKLKELLGEHFRVGKGWQVHEGTSYITTIFENGKEMAFEITFRDKKGPERDKWRKSAASKWANISRKIHNNPELNEIGNPVLKSWEECFQEALNDDEMKPYIRTTDRSPVF